MKRTLLTLSLVLISIFASAQTAKLSVTDVTLSKDTIMVGDTLTISGKVNNLSNSKTEDIVILMMDIAPDGFGDISPIVMTENAVALEGNASQEIEYSFCFSVGDDERFVLYYIDSKGNRISDYYKFQLGECGTEVKKIELTTTKYGLKEGLSETVLALIFPLSAPQTATWTTSDESIVEIEKTEENGLLCYFNCVGPGTATLTATAVNGMTAICTVQVEPKGVKSESVTLDIHEFTGAVGDQVQLHATILPENVTLPIVMYETRGRRIATVTNDGLVTIVGEGETEILAWALDCSGAQDVCKIIATASAINSVNADNPTSGKVYNLQGQKLSGKPEKGIYIINGKKMIKE